MKANRVQVPDSCPKENYWLRRKTKFERVYKSHEPERPKLNIDKEVSNVLHPPSSNDVSKMPKRPETYSSDSYRTRQRTNSLPEKPYCYWNQSNNFQFSTKQFPLFKTSAAQPKKTNSILKPTLVRSSSVNLYNDCTKDTEDFCTKEVSDKNSDYPTSLKPSKRVKWEDGYHDTSGSEWNPYDDYYKDYIPPKAKPSFSYEDLPSYMNYNYNKQLFRDDEYEKYGYMPYRIPNVAYYSSPRYPNDYRDSYHLYSDYPKNPRYGHSNNWFYVEEDPKIHNFHLDNLNMKKYNDSIRKSYKDCDTQYDIERVHNKKLQVYQSDSPKSPDKRVKVENKKVGDDSGGIKTTNEAEMLKKVEETSTQTIATENQRNSSGTKLKEREKNDEEVINKLLQGLTEKLKTSELSLSIPKQKCILVERETQYAECDTKKKSLLSKVKNPRKHCYSTSTEKQLKPKVIVMQNESTQFEDLRTKEHCKTKTSFSITDLEFDRQFRKKKKKFNLDNFREIEYKKKVKEIKSDVCEVVKSHAKKLTKGKDQRKTKEERKESVENQLVKKLQNSDHSAIKLPRSYVDTKQCLPFWFGNKKKWKEKPNSTSSNSANRRLEYKQIENKPKEKQDKLSVLSRTESELSEDSVEKKKCKKKFSPLSIISTDSDWSSPDDRYLEKYVVKLSHPQKEIFLYDVKPQLCDYLCNKGIKKGIVRKFMSSSSRD